MGRTKQLHEDLQEQHLEEQRQKDLATAPNQMIEKFSQKQINEIEVQDHEIIKYKKIVHL